MTISEKEGMRKVSKRTLAQCGEELKRALTEVRKEEFNREREERE